MDKPNAAVQPAHPVPHVRRWSPFELLLVAMAVWVVLMVLAFAAPLFFIALGE